MKRNSRRRKKIEVDNRFSHGREAEVLHDLKDEYYLKLVDDFLGLQTGEGLQLFNTPCQNRLLVQLGLLKEENRVPWVALLKWLVKILPQHWSADFRCLIERAFATALSLEPEPRKIFLDTEVNFSFVGPICDSIGVDRKDLLEMKDFSQRAQQTEVTNGLILELMNFVIREQIAPLVLVTWLRNFNPKFCKNGDTQKAYIYLRPRIKKLKQSYHNHETKSHRRNPAMESLLQSPFELVPKRQNSKRCFFKKRSKRSDISCVKEEHQDTEIIEGVFLINQRVPKRRIAEIEDDSSDDDDASDISNSNSNSEEILTLLDIAVLSVQKLPEEHVFALLKNQYSLSCKEKAGMAEFESKLSLLSGQISLASPLVFVHANAKFLAELDDVIMKQILQFEMELVESTKVKLGRDGLPEFENFSNFSESATARYIHMASGLLHSENSQVGIYRNYWVAFCKEKENAARLEVDHLYRFNSYFKAAAGLTHHHKEVALFLSDLITLSSHECRNIILESLSADAQDSNIQSLVCVLAIIYCKIVGPYWQLLQSNAEYSLFSQNLLNLYQKFLDWSKDCSTLLEPEAGPTVFMQTAIEEEIYRGVFEYCRMWYTNRDLIRSCVRTLIKKISGVADKHLKDFLPGGRFSQVPSQELRAELKSCTFSVLMEKYPPKTLEGSSENDSFSSSDSSMEDDDQAVSSEDSVSTNPVRQKVKTEKLQRKEVESKLQQIIVNPDEDYFTAMVHKNGGPCKSQQDVDKLMLLFEERSRYEKHIALICEVLYQKKVLNNTSEHLASLSGNTSITKIKANLKLSLPRARPGYSIVITPIKK